MPQIITYFEIIGTIAFAISGALMSISAGLDIFGVVFVGCITAVGGGITRDLMIGVHPPAIFENFEIFLVAIVTCILVFVISYIYRKKFVELRKKIEYINNFFDAIGLAAFAVIGSEVGFKNGFSDNVFIIVVIGMITGVGGGIFRDILLDTTPYVFKKHIYAVAAIAGSASYALIRKYDGNATVGSLFSIVFIVLIRLLSTRYCWNLPKVYVEEDK